MAKTYGRVAMNRRVMVNLTTGTAFDGVLWDERGPLIVLKDANIHTNGQSSPLDREVIIAREQIEFVQVVG